MFDRSFGAALALGAVMVIVPSLAEARLTGQAREVYLEGSFRKCLASSKRNHVASLLPEKIVSRICTCTINYTADRLTNRDAAIGTYGNRSEVAEIDRKSDALNRAGMDICKQAHRRS